MNLLTQNITYKFTKSKYNHGKIDFIDLINRNRTVFRHEYFFDEKYCGRTFINKDPLIYFCRCHNKAVGSVSLFPTPTNNCLMKDKCIYHIGDLSIDKEHRRKGIGQKIIKYSVENAGDDKFFIIFPTPEATGIFQKLKWKKLAVLRTYTLILQLPCKKKYKKIIDAINTFLNKFWRVLLNKQINKVCSDYFFEEVFEFDSSFDELWNKISSKKMLMICRDRQCLSWRYSSYNEKTKVIKISDEKEIKGFIIVKLAQNNHKYEIIDIAYDSYPIFNALISYVINTAITNNIKIVEIRFNNKRKTELKKILKSGFLKRKEIWNIYGLCSNNNISEKLFSKPENWIFTTADKEI